VPLHPFVTNLKINTRIGIARISTGISSSAPIKLLLLIDFYQVLFFLQADTLLLFKVDLFGVLRQSRKRLTDIAEKNPEERRNTPNPYNYSSPKDGSLTLG